MCKDDKRHKINVAYNLIETVLGDTDIDSSAFNDLLNALMGLLLNDLPRSYPISWQRGVKENSRHRSGQEHDKQWRL